MVPRQGAEPAERIVAADQSLHGGAQGSSAAATEADLVQRLKNGDRQASEQLIRRYQDKAFATAFRMMSGDREEALDLTQEAFLTALRNIDKFEGKSSFYTWFYRILVNTCLDALRRRKRRNRFFFTRRREPETTREPSDFLDNVADGKESANPVSMLDARELQRDIAEAMKNLSDRQRMIFELKVFEEMRIPEIAHTMSLAEGTVKSHLFRATRIMRDALADWTGR